MKKLFLATLTLFALVAQTQAQVATKADSLMSVIATQQHIDTNATAAEIGQAIDNAVSLVPGPHAGPIKWLHFLMALLGIIVMAYFFIKHEIAINKLKDKVPVILLFVGLGAALSLSSCKSGNLLNNFVSYAQQHCPETKVSNPLTGEVAWQIKCDSLWVLPQAVTDNCSNVATVNIQVSTGTVTLSGTCQDTTVLNLLKKATFKK
ncbi:MAG TPA: hypothetical protein VG603_11345 [Chitinophagales bacterium]|nr:hypothetical protein [Chitinophagales bacterium]